MIKLLVLYIIYAKDKEKAQCHYNISQYFLQLITSLLHIAANRKLDDAQLTSRCHVRCLKEANMFRRMGVYVIILVLAMAGCGGGGEKPQKPTSTPLNPGPSVSCSELLIIGLRHIDIRDTAASLIDPSGTNQIQAVVLLADMNGNPISEFNYRIEPFTVRPGTGIDLDHFHAAIEIADLEAVYVWIMIKDTDNGSLSSDILTASTDSLIGAAVSAGLTVLGAGNVFILAADVVWNLAFNLFTDHVAQDDLITDLAFMLDAGHGWGIGRHTAQNDMATIVFDIQHHQPHCVNFFPGSQAGTNGSPCSARVPGSRLQPGDYAVVDVDEGDHLIFHPLPDTQIEGTHYAPGITVLILDSFVCDGETMLWSVMNPYSGAKGWMAESGYDTEVNQAFYYLRPD